MPSIADIRTGLRDTVSSAVAGLTCYDRVPESVNLPALIVLPRATNFNGAMARGLDTYDFDLIVLVSRVDDALAQTKLDEYVNGFGASSIRQAIWNARTLGLSNTEASVTGMDRYGAAFDIGGGEHVGAVLSARVLTTGTA